MGLPTYETITGEVLGSHLKCRFPSFPIRQIINVAAGKAPMQISTDEGGVPQKALDGSTAFVYSADTCTLTKCERVPWWYVNLLEPYMVQLVRLDFGKPCC
ncbi:jg21814, partial [Pararge aegeria aegeria]